MNDTGLAAETRRLLDAATGDSEDGNTGAELFDMFIDGGGDIVYWPDGDAVAHVYPGVMTGVEPQALAALIAAAPRLLANWLARQDRLADENRALREAIETHEDLHRPVGPDSPNGPIHMDGWPCCDDDRHLWAAADRGDTDGDRNEGDEE